MAAYFQSRRCPDRKYRIVRYDKVKRIVTLCDVSTDIEFDLPETIVRENGFKLVKEQ